MKGGTISDLSASPKGTIATAVEQFIVRPHFFAHSSMRVDLALS